MIMKHITMDEFEAEVLQADQPVLVDFYATWCGPCKMMSPIIDKISESMEGKAKVFKVDVDKESKLAQQYRIMSVPTLLLFKNGDVAEQVTGAVAQPVLEEKLNSLL